MKSRVFVSFDYDNDAVLKEFLIGQSKLDDSPFFISDWSIKVASPGWKEEARRRIRASDVVAVLCGEHTDSAVGVDVEVRIAQEERIPYFLLKGYKDVACVKPKAAKTADKLYAWTWPHLKTLIGGGR
ncbi:TIR domain-containing protein [Streptomyces sp. NPDC052727]|uniref:TIR domain-containing protein n=1 Tax=Streptomyces sp. NPDC052727 TaxID=3154854 RepID=UPI00342F046B